ncbi:protein SLOW GREEN 1, chloroplastic-like [Hordeum vulgare subsp. vulgare]|nr:protein SLOW GREEN 1, chloroplastic-like [Hordeum vulgare subsp. vulgare]
MPWNNMRLKCPYSISSVPLQSPCLVVATAPAMAMSFLSTANTSFVPFRRLSRHKPTTTPSLPFPTNPHRSPACCLLPAERRRFSTPSSSKTPATNLLSSITAASRTLLFLLVVSILSLSVVRRPLPSLAAPPPPTQQPQDATKGQQEEESDQGDQEEEDEAEWFRKEEEEVEAAWMQPSDEEEEEEDDDEVQMYLEVLSEDPGDVDALKCVLFARMRRKDWGGALRYAAQLREAEPGEVEWRLMEALLHELKGDIATAERLFQEVLAEKPLLVRALHGLALCMHKRLEGPTVFEMLEKALQLAESEERVPEERNIKLLIAQMHVVKGDLDVASEKLRTLINEDPRDFRPHLCQGIVYALLDKKEEADEQFDVYRSLVPDEFPDKSFINDVILSAKVESKDRLQKDLRSEYLSKK